MTFNVAIIGATGAVGQEMLKILEKRNFPVKSLRLFASPKSIGKTLKFKKEEVPLELLDNFKGIDIALFSAGRKISSEWGAKAVEDGAVVIDNSSAFRSDPTVPLVIPEINAHAITRHQGIIASPNCTTTIMLIPLAPLHKQFQIKRVVCATYQAASGAGALAMQELVEETRATLEGKPYERTIFERPYAFNLFTHNSPLTETGYVEEELKMLYETKKILEDDSIRVSATCIRVPILRAHSVTMNVEFAKPINKHSALTILKNAPGLQISSDPTPKDASGIDSVLCGRIREDLSQPNTLELWAVGDQLLKGAALNAIQIAEHL